MRSVSGSKWGADQETLLRIYRALIRSKIDYGCIVCGSASETALKHLDVVVCVLAKEHSNQHKLKT